MKTISYKDRQPARIDFPLVSDPNLEIAKEYGMIQPTTSSTKDVRGVFIVDPRNKVRAMFFYPMEIGRNLGEIERTLVTVNSPGTCVSNGKTYKLTLFPGIKQNQAIMKRVFRKTGTPSL